jgi:hypothetical protein
MSTISARLESYMVKGIRPSKLKDRHPILSSQFENKKGQVGVIL